MTDDPVVRFEVAFAIIGAEEAYYARMQAGEEGKTLPSRVMRDYCENQIQTMIALAETLTANDVDMVDAILSGKILTSYRSG